MVNIVLGSMFFIVLLLGFLYWQTYGIKTINLLFENENIPKNFDGVKILHLSDFHNSKPCLEKTIQIAKKEKPDYIFFTGDIIDSRKTDIKIAEKLLIALNEICKVYYILGNHEVRIKNLQEFKETVKNTKTLLLENEKITLNNNGDIISLIGICDQNLSSNKTTSKMQKENYKNHIKRLAVADNTFKILLIHRPEYFREYVENGYDLIFAGHTHGGQFNIPFTDIGVYVPDQGLFAKYAKGIKTKDKSTLVISSGIGNSSFPFRLFNRPEIIAVTLKCK